MEVEVSWLDIKNTCSRGCSLAHFLGALCKFIHTVLGEEHMQRLIDAGTPNAYISDPQPKKAMYDAVQEIHLKTLSACFLIETSNRLKFPEIIYRDLMEVVMESEIPNAFLHLKIVAAHEDRIREGADTILHLSDLKMVLMPRQWFLRKLDPDNKLSVPELRNLLEDHRIEYKEALVLHDWLDPHCNVKDFLRIYRKWNLITSAPKWGRTPSPAPAKSVSPFVCASVLSCWLPCSALIVPVQYIAV